MMMQEYRTPQFDPDNDPIRKMAEGVSSLIDGVASLFKKEKTAEKSTSSAVSTTTSTESDYSSVGNMLQSDNVSFYMCDFSNIVSQVQSHTQLSSSMLCCIDQVRAGRGGADSLTYEEILKLYMDTAADLSSLSYLDGAISVLEKFCKVAIGFIPSVQTIALSATWGAMIFDLIKKASSEPTDSERKRVAAACVALLAFATQVFHKEMPLWNYVGIVYKGFAMAGDYVRENPRLYRALFPNKFIDVNTFPTWHKELEKHVGRSDKLTIGKAFNIHYTFRIGDVFIVKLGKPGLFGDDVMDRMKEQLSPIPTENELQRLFALYTNKRMYY